MSDKGLGAKRVQHLELSESVTAALRDIAERLETTIDTVAEDFLLEAIERFRQDMTTMTKVRIIERHIPDTLAGVDTDHPVFGGKEPVRAKVKRRYTYN